MFHKLLDLFKTPDLSFEETIIRLNNIGYMIDCGLHSGFPPCCVRYYVLRIFFTKRQNAKYYRTLDRHGSFGYCPCPSCLRRNNIVKVQPCPENARCFYIDELPDLLPKIITREEDRALAPQLKKQMQMIGDGFQIIKNGGARNGAVASNVAHHIRAVSKRLSQ